MLSPDLIEELRIIFQEDYGISLNNKEASEVANTLAGIFETLFKADFKNKYDNENYRNSNR